jgi:hypothetical protein
LTKKLEKYQTTESTESIESTEEKCTQTVPKEEIINILNCDTRIELNGEEYDLV